MHRITSVTAKSLVSPASNTKINHFAWILFRAVDNFVSGNKYNLARQMGIGRGEDDGTGIKKREERGLVR